MKATGLKRMFAVILVLVLGLSLSAPAFAAEAEQPVADSVCTGLEDCPAAQHNEGCLKAAAADAVPAGNNGNGAEGEDPVQEPDPPACTCGAVEGAAHTEGCPLYVAPVCTCGAAEGAAHTEGCPLYVAPTCTCGAVEGQPHTEGCPLYVAPACTCGAVESQPHTGGCPLYVAPACTCGAVESQPHTEGCPLYVAPTCTCGAGEGQPHAEGCPLYEKPVDEAAANVQAMIDALPEASAVTAENADAVKAQLEAIDAAKLQLTDEQLDGLNIERYVAVAAALDAVYEAMALANAVAKIGDQLYNTLEEAMQAAGENGIGTEITLLQSISDRGKIYIQNKTITINLAGKDIGFALGGRFIINGGTLNLTGQGMVYEQKPDYAPVMLYGSADPTAVNYSVVNVDSGVTLRGWAGVFINQRTDDTDKPCNWGMAATIKGTLISKKDTGGYVGSGLYVNGLISNANNAPKITLDGATVTAEDGGIGMYLAGYAETTVSNSTITSTSEGGTGIEIRAGELTIENSTITGGNGESIFVKNGNGASSQNVGLAVAQHTTKLPIQVRVLSGTLTGGAAFAEENPETNEQAAIDQVELDIQGGEFEGEVHSQDKTDFITGGNFSEPVAQDYCAPGYSPTDVDANGNYTVCNHPKPLQEVVDVATCAKPGHETYYHCTACNRNFRDQDALNEITNLDDIATQINPNHTYDNTRWYADANQHWHECTVCHQAKTDVANHSFQWVADINGVKHHVCSVCGYSNMVTLTLHFDPNQGQKAPAAQTVDTDTGSGTIVITKLRPYRLGHFFQGWSTARDGNVQYRPGDSITITQDTTLYAVWARPTDSPRTGDTSNIVLWAAVAGVCLVGIGVAVVIIKKKGGKE